MKLIPTILSGGSGSRLWPLSRQLHPKPFIRLADGQSLLQKAWLRGAVLPGVVEMMTVTNSELALKTQQDYNEIAAFAQLCVPNGFVLEPCGRNTAPAIAAAALTVANRHGADALMLVLAADHLITDQDALAQAVQRAVLIARQGKLVTFGIQPSRPETGYGYIESDLAGPIDDAGVRLGFAVRRFVEKPSLEQAKIYLAGGHHQWNSGMFCFAAGALLQQMAQHCPSILAATRACMTQSKYDQRGSLTQLQLDAASFAAVPDDSIDFALMEKSSQVAVVPCDLGWSDIGSWDAMGELIAPDARGNRIEGGHSGEVKLHEVDNCYIRASAGRVIGAVGLSDLIIIDTPDALLVAKRGQTQDVRHIYAGLQATGHAAHKLHRSLQQPGGGDTVLETGQNFTIRQLELKPGAFLNLHADAHCSRHLVVVSGTARFVDGETETLLQANEATCISAGQQQRLENPALSPLLLIEIQLPVNSRHDRAQQMAVLTAASRSELEARSADQHE